MPSLGGLVPVVEVWPFDTEGWKPPSGHGKVAIACVLGEITHLSTHLWRLPVPSYLPTPQSSFCPPQITLVCYPIAISNPCPCGAGFEACKLAAFEYSLLRVTCSHAWFPVRQTEQASSSNTCKVYICSAGQLLLLWSKPQHAPQEDKILLVLQTQRAKFKRTG